MPDGPPPIQPFPIQFCAARLGAPARLSDWGLLQSIESCLTPFGHACATMSFSSKRARRCRRGSQRDAAFPPSCARLARHQPPFADNGSIVSDRGEPASVLDVKAGDEALVYLENMPDGLMRSTLPSRSRTTWWTSTAVAPSSGWVTCMGST